MVDSPESAVVVETVNEDSDDEDTADTEVITRYGEVGQKPSKEGPSSHTFLQRQ